MLLIFQQAAEWDSSSTIQPLPRYGTLFISKDVPILATIDF